MEAFSWNLEKTGVNPPALIHKSIPDGPYGIAKFCHCDFPRGQSILMASERINEPLM